MHVPAAQTSAPLQNFPSSHCVSREHSPASTLGTLASVGTGIAERPQDARRKAVARHARTTERLIGDTLELKLNGHHTVRASGLHIPAEIDRDDRAGKRLP